LNGRVYGARKHPHYASVNAFANAPDHDDEFVEWGHGGMGSVRAGGMWAKVQSDQKVLIGHTEERGRRGTPTAPAPPTDDDGSGMGWVKKRREEREQKKREEEAAREAASKTSESSTSSPVSDPPPSPTSQLPAGHKVSTIALSQPSPENDDEDDSDDEEETKDDLLDDESSSTEQEDDDATEEQHLKQILGAGVERVSRHRD